MAVHASHLTGVICILHSLSCACTGLMALHQDVYTSPVTLPVVQAIGSRAANAGRQTAAKRRASAGQAEAERKPKSRRLSDFSDVATSISRYVWRSIGWATCQLSG
jgi:hypothetical protein